MSVYDALVAVSSVAAAAAAWALMARARRRVRVVLYGAPALRVPRGTVVATERGQAFRTVEAVEIGPSGHATAAAVAVRLREERTEEAQAGPGRGGPPRRSADCRKLFY